MADNTRVLNPESTENVVAGDEIATDDIGGVKHQRIKLIHGNDGVNDGDVSTSNPLPTTATQTQNLLTQILLELRVMNFHLSTMTDNNVGQTEL